MTESAKKLIQLQEAYIKLLVEELEETIVLATYHGWKSTRYQQGVDFRNKIQSMKRHLLNGKTEKEREK